jgi:hypothetical protein
MIHDPCCRLFKRDSDVVAEGHDVSIRDLLGDKNSTSGESRRYAVAAESGNDTKERLRVSKKQTILQQTGPRRS